MDDLNESKVSDFQGNRLFNKFHHLFEYDATYYSYLVAKVASQRLYAMDIIIKRVFEEGAMFNFRDIK